MHKGPTARLLHVCLCDRYSILARRRDFRRARGFFLQARHMYVPNVDEVNAKAVREGIRRAASVVVRADGNRVCSVAGTRLRKPACFLRTHAEGMQKLGTFRLPRGSLAESTRIARRVAET